MTGTAGHRARNGPFLAHPFSGKLIHLGERWPDDRLYAPCSRGIRTRQSTMPLYCAAGLICLDDACTCSRSFTRSMGATAVLDTAAATPPASRSFPKDAASKSRFSAFFSGFFFGVSRCIVGSRTEKPAAESQNRRERETVKKTRGPLQRRPGGKAALRTPGDKHAAVRASCAGAVTASGCLALGT